MVFYQQGEYPAFVQLYERHAGKVYGYLRNHLANKSEAEDLLQVVFLKLHENRARYNENLPFLPWLFSISRNTIIDHLRKKKSIPVDASVLESLMEPQFPQDSKATEKEIQAVLSILPTDQKELLEMRFQEGLTFEEIAMKLDSNSSAVRKRVSRTVQTAKKLWERKNG